MKHIFSIADLPPNGTPVSPFQFHSLASSLSSLKEKRANNQHSRAATSLFVGDNHSSLPDEETTEQKIRALELFLTQCPIDYKTTVTGKVGFSGDSQCIVFRQRNLITKKIIIGYYERSKILEKCGLTKLFRDSYEIYRALLNHHIGDLVNIYSPTISQIEIIYLS